MQSLQLALCTGFGVNVSSHVVAITYMDQQSSGLFACMQCASVQWVNYSAANTVGLLPL